MGFFLTQAVGQKNQPKQGQKHARGTTKPTTQAHEPTTEPTAKISGLTEMRKSRKAAELKNTTKVLQIISEESGVALEDLTDDSSFADLGVDSLLSMIISSRIQEEIGINADSWEFSDHPTVKHLKEFLSEGDGASQVKFEGEEEEEEEAIPVVPFESDPSQLGSQSATIRPIGLVNGGNENLDFGRIVQIVSEESGVPVDDLTDDSALVELGVDDVMRFIIAGRCKESFGLDVDTGSLFVDVHTVKDLKKSVSVLIGEVSTSVPQTKAPNQLVPSVDTSSRRFSHEGRTDSYSSQTGTPRNSDTTSAGSGQGQGATPATSNMEEGDIGLKPASVNLRPASSVIVQGRPQDCKKILFLFADGAGSASSYTNLPKVNNELAIIGLNSPYVRFPEEMTCTLDQLIDKYITELRRRQPVGPYRLGGWSAGGILAYRAAQHFVRRGEEVETLVLIDSPVPKGLDKLPVRFMEHCQRIGLWKGTVQTSRGAPPKTLFAHFMATMNILRHFYAEPLPEGIRIRCSILFATESIFTEDKAFAQGDDVVEDMRFLTEKRTDFSAGGWRDLVPGGEVVVERLEGSHHFSMMQGDAVEETARFIDRAMGRG